MSTFAKKQTFSAHDPNKAVIRTGVNHRCVSAVRQVLLVAITLETYDQYWH